VRRILLDTAVPIKSHITEVALFTADRAEQWADIIEPALDSGRVVVSDRNWYSTLAYQTASDPAMEEKIITVTNTLLPSRYVKPDLAIVLSLSEEVRRQRRLFREQDNVPDSFEQRDNSFFEKVHKIYEQIPRKLGAVAISADAAPNEVFSQVWAEFERVIR
ncbi:MAG: hypothetical protein ABIR46_01985, partial [Candidatus Saccharimonadales bacterium]